MKRRCKWNIPSCSVTDAEALAKDLGISNATARLLINRGLGDYDVAYDFLKKRTDIFHDPFSMCDMDKAVSRLHKAIETGEKITVYGDYDVDGITATSSMILYLRQFTSNVSYYIPSRSGEGYGVNSAAIQKLYDSGTRLLITVDTGITAIEEIDFANSLGIDVIVTDHHQCRDTLPCAFAVINPKRKDSKYPFPELAGVGVVFKLCCAYEIFNTTGDLFFDKNKTDDIISSVRRVCTKLCDLVSIGTVADVMPVLDENRLIVTAGLYLIQKTKNIGIKALLSACNIAPSAKKPITTSTISYTLAPRINAMGRMSEAGAAVEMFLTSDTELAQQTAQTLCVMNAERQQEENRIVEEAENMIKNDPSLLEHKMLVLSGHNWHHGVVGIVASRLVEKYSVPTILVSFDGEAEIGKGSGRSIPGFDLVKALSSQADMLEKYGGHKAAAGLSVSADNFNAFAANIIDYADNSIPEDTTVTVDVDAELTASDITPKFVEELSMLEPYGLGNLTPLFLLRNVTVLGTFPTSTWTHTRLSLGIGGKTYSAMYFGMHNQRIPDPQNGLIDCLFNLSFNDYGGKRTIQLILRDCIMSGDQEDEYESESELAEDIIQDRIYPESRYIPDRNDIVKIYKHLKFYGTDVPIEINTCGLCRILGFNVIKTLLSYAILSELKLIEVKESGRYSYEITVFSGKDKTQLDASPLYLRLTSYVK